MLLDVLAIDREPRMRREVDDGDGRPGVPRPEVEGLEDRAAGLRTVGHEHEEEIRPLALRLGEDRPQPALGLDAQVMGQLDPITHLDQTAVPRRLALSRGAPDHEVRQIPTPEVGRYFALLDGGHDEAGPSEDRLDDR